MDPVRQLEEFYAQQEPYIEALRTKATCSPACTGCCYPLVRYSVVEAIPLIQLVTIGEDRLTSYMQKLVEVRNDPDAWMRLKLPCLFLQEGKCSVYLARPWICRAHFVKSDPKICESLDPSAVTDVLDVSTSTPAYFAMLQKIGEETGLPYGPIPYPLSIRWARVYLRGGILQLRHVMQRDIKCFGGGAANEQRRDEALEGRSVRSDATPTE